MTVFFFWKKKY